MNYTLGIDIGSTTVKIAILDEAHHILFSDYKRHFANIQETLSDLLKDSLSQLGNITLHPMITGSGGLTLANHLGVPFVQEVISVSTALQELAPRTDVAIELGGEDAKIIYFENGNVDMESPIVLLEILNQEIYLGLKKYFEENDVNYIDAKVGCTVGIHSGIKACGIFFIEK